jgi:hypothetical protein
MAVSATLASRDMLIGFAERQRGDEECNRLSEKDRQIDHNS